MQIYFDLVDGGHISADQLMAAMRRQVSLRHPIGQLAVENEMMRMGEVFDVLAQQRTSREPFGQLAMRMGYLSREQLGELILQQLDGVPTVTEILVRQGCVSQETIDCVTRRSRRRNEPMETPHLELLEAV